MNKKVVVTGGSNGLGLAITRKHLELGDDIWVIDNEKTPEIMELTSKNKNVILVYCDISKTANVKNALDDIVPAIGNIDCLYSCAGIFKYEEKVPLSETILDDAAYMYEVNAVGFLRVVQALLPVIKDGCVIMCVTSEAGSIGENTRSQEYNYCMSKAAENMACHILQKHFDSIPQNTRVMCIHPGWMRTRMGGQDAINNPQSSIAPEESAEAIIGIANDIESIPKERMYMDYKRKDFPW